ncbi:MAG: hypothetical protein LBD94_00585 [Rickettsiales bacterium]|jgi:hypothetical protein|nr:hypothetical protein [Rickettsiales bacterium]
MVDYPEFYKSVNVVKYKKAIEARLFFAQYRGMYVAARRYFIEWLRLMSYVQKYGGTVLKYGKIGKNGYFVFDKHAQKMI